MRVHVMLGTECADYVADLLLQGFRVLLGAANVTWWPPKAHLGGRASRDEFGTPEWWCWLGAPDCAGRMRGSDADVLVLCGTPDAREINEQVLTAAHARAGGKTVIAVDGADWCRVDWLSTVAPYAHHLFIREPAGLYATAQVIEIPVTPCAETPPDARSHALLWAGRADALRAPFIDAARKIKGALVPDESLSIRQWLGALSVSKICLVLPGHGRQTHRHFDAAQYGCAIMTVPSGYEIPHDYVDGESAVFIRRPEDIAGKVAWLLEDDRWRQVAARGRAYVTEHHVPRAIAQRILVESGCRV